MSDYEFEDEREMDEIDTSEPVGSAKVTLDVPVPTVEQVAGTIARQLISQAGYDSKRMIENQVADAVNALVETKVAAIVGPAIDEFLKRPMQPTDGFGNPIGEPVTMAGIVTKQVEQWAAVMVSRDGKPIGKDSYGGYGRESMTRLEFSMAQLVDRDLQAAVKKEVDAIKVQLKAKASAVIAKQIAEQVAALVIK